MKAKIIITLSFIAAIAIMTGCTKQPYYDIPYDENGNVYITKISIKLLPELQLLMIHLQLTAIFQMQNPEML